MHVKSSWYAVSETHKSLIVRSSYPTHCWQVTLFYYMESRAYCRLILTFVRFDDDVNNYYS